MKGQECKLVIASAEGPVASLQKTTDFDVTLKGEILKEDYTGQEDPEYDSIGDGCDIKLTAHLPSKEAITFVEKIQAIRRRVGTEAEQVISIVVKFDFPDGTVLGFAQGVHFGDIPLNVKGRKAFVTIALTGSCSTMKFKRL